MFKKYYIFIFCFVAIATLTRAQTKSYNLLPDTIFLCSGDSVAIKFPEELTNKNTTVLWSTPTVNTYHSKQFYVSKKGKYNVKLNDGKKYYFDTTYVKINDKPKLNIRDTLLCGNANLLILTKNKNYKYTWSTLEITDFINISKEGKYWVKANNKGCYFTDTFKVQASVGTILNFGKELLICESETNKTLSVKVPSDVKIYWNNGSLLHSINATKEGIYWVKSISKNCGTRTDSVTVKYKSCDCEVFIPNSFTPNEDDRNDLFAPVFQCEYTYFVLTIQDRWGNTVYNSANINAKWDGRFKGNPCPDDVYVYHLEAIQKGNDKKLVKNGHISLFR